MKTVSEDADRQLLAGSDRGRSTKGLRITFIVVAVVMLVGSAGFYGRWTTAHRYESGGLRSTQGTGTQSGGGEGPFTLSGRDTRLSWHMNQGVVRIQVAVIPAAAGARFAEWPENKITAPEVGGLEFSTPDRSGSWSLSSLPAGEYWVRYQWSTRGAGTGVWSFRVEQRLPWWQRGSS